MCIRDRYFCHRNLKNKDNMAKTEQEIRGKVGNMVFYKMGSETRVRSTASDFQDADSEGQRSGLSLIHI